ncbi:BaeS Signal transduction histidine kinase [Burkholderiaceae bacterium]
MGLARALLWLLFTVLSIGAHAKSEDDLIIERGLYVEPAPGALTIEQALTQQYKPFVTVLNREFSPTVRWLKLLVAAPQQGSEQVVLRIGPHYIGHIQLFEHQQGTWTSRSAGDRFPVSQNACADNTYCFPVTIHAGVDNYFYVRIDTLNGYILTTRAMTPEDLSSLLVEQQRVFGIEFGVVLVICLWALFIYIRTRHRLAGIFFISEVVTLLFSLSTSGLLANLYFEDHVWMDNLSFNTLYVLRLIASLLVTLEFLRHFGAPKWYSFYVKGAIGILLLQLFALKLGPVTLIALNFNFLIVTLMPIMMLVALTGCHQMPLAHKRLIAVGALIVAGLLWTDILPVLGWVKPSIVTIPGNWGGVIVAIALSLMVNSDLTHRRIIYDREMQELQYLRARNLAESEQIKDRSMLIDMLTHELKNPLATMRMAAGSLTRSLGVLTTEQSKDSADRIDSMVQAINNMNTVIERCVQVDQLDQKGFSPKLEDVDVYQVVHDVLTSQAEAQRLEFRPQSSTLIFRTDPNLFAIILTNLLDNAIKYSEPDSLITLEIELNEALSVYPAKLKMRVSNTVSQYGVPDSVSLFSRYYRGPLAHEKSGTGLGLYLVKSLCKILRGSIRFEHNNGLVHFTVELK